MANVKISALSSLAEGDIVTSTDVIPIVDASAGETKKSTSQAVVNAGLKAPGPIGGTTPNVVTATTVLSNSGVIGYTTGAGGTVSQSSWGANVTLNKICGQIGIFNSVVTAGTHAFNVINSTVNTGSIILLNQITGYDSDLTYTIGSVFSGGFSIVINSAAGTTTSNVVLAFAVFSIVIS